MKKKWNLVLVVSAILLSVNSFSQALNKGNTLLSVGYIFVPTDKLPDYNENGVKRTFSHKNIGVFTASSEFITSEKVGIGHIAWGLLVSFNVDRRQNEHKSSKIHILSKTENLQTSFIGRSAYHFALPLPNLDLYAGIRAGFHVNLITDHSQRTILDQTLLEPWDKPYQSYINDYTQLRFVVGAYIGARYFFTSKFGLLIEFNPDLPVFNKTEHTYRLGVGLTWLR